MKPQIGKKYLITTDGWFFAPDGETYRAVWGTVKGVLTSEDTLGVKTNSKSTNWYVSIGNMLVAGCQIHYVIQSNAVSFAPGTSEIEHEGKRHVSKLPMSRIYNADVNFANAGGDERREPAPPLQ